MQGSFELSNLTRVLVSLGWAVLAVLPLGLCGCPGGSPGPTGNVSGKVSLGGEPLGQWEVVFYGADGVPGGSATLSPSGEFRLGQPIPVGDYQVAVAPPGEEAPAGEEADPQRAKILEKVPPRYWDHTTSGLSAQVTEGDNTVTFEIEAP